MRQRRHTCLHSGVCTALHLGTGRHLGDAHAKNPGAPFPAPVPQPPVHLRRLSEEASSSALPPQLPARRRRVHYLLPRSLRPGESARLTAVPGALAARRVLEAATVPWGPASSLGRGAPAGWRAGGRAPPARPGAQALLPRGRLCGECSSTDCRRRTSRSSQSASGSSPFSTARRSDRLFAGGNST